MSSPSEAPPPLLPRALERRASDGAAPPLPPRPSRRISPLLSPPPAEQLARDRAPNGTAGGSAALPPMPNVTASPASESNAPQIYNVVPPKPARLPACDPRSTQILASDPQKQRPVELADTAPTEASDSYGQAMIPPRAPTSAAVGGQSQENGSYEAVYVRSSTPVGRRRYKSSSSALTASTDSNIGQSPQNAGIRKQRRNPSPAKNGSATTFRSQLVELPDAELSQDTYGCGTMSSSTPSNLSRPPPARQFSSPDTKCAQDLKRALSPREPPTRPAIHKSSSKADLEADCGKHLSPIAPERSPNGSSKNFATTTIGRTFPSDRDSRLAADEIRSPREVQLDRRKLSKPIINLSHSKHLFAIDSSSGSTSSLNNSSPLTRSPYNRGRALPNSPGVRLGSAHNLCANDEGRDQFGLTFPLRPAALSSDPMSRSMIALDSSHASFYNYFPEHRNGLTRFDAAESHAPGSSPPPDFKTFPARPKPSPLGSPPAAARFSGLTSTRIGSETPIEPPVMWRRGTRGAPSDSSNCTTRSASRQPKSSQLPPLCEVEGEECPQHAVQRLSWQLVRYICSLSGVLV